MPNLGSTDQSTVVLIKIIIWDAVLTWLNGGVSSKVDCIVAAPIWHIYFPTLPPSKVSISALTLAMVTNKVALKRKRNVLQ